MSWTINNQSPESLNLRVVSISENTDTASEAVLAVTSASYTQTAAFSFGSIVSIARNGVNVFVGKVFQTPRSASASTEGLEYVLKDAWYDLERLVYQVEREYVSNVTPPPDGDDEDSTLEFVDSYIGTTTFETNVPLGERISMIVEYAEDRGLNIAVGNIDDGIDWYRTENKDRTCAEMIREMLQMMPDYVAWFDNSTSPPQFNLATRSSMPSRVYTIGQDVVTDHSIIRHDSENVPCVVIRYEKPISIDSENYTEITEDIAPFNADPTQLGTMVETVGIQGGLFQNEYARVTTDTIPQDDASDDDIKKWWIEYTPILKSIAENNGLDELLALVKIPKVDVPAENVKKHKVSVVVDNLPKPPPINKNSTPIEQTDEPKDYPRHIIEGTLPEWANKRYRPILAEVTMGVLADSVDAISDDNLKAAIKDVFNVPKTFDDKVYLTGLLNGRVTGTNAVTKNYKRAVTSNPGETAPTGIAQQLLDQINLDRFSGDLTVVGQDPDTITKVGQRLNILGGRSEWSTMGEAIQSVTHNIQEGSTAITFGPAQNLGANDLIDRLRASRLNQFGFGIQSGQDINEGLGGTSATPVFGFTLQSGAPTSIHPWLGTLTGEAGDQSATTTEGRIYDGLLSVTEVTPTITEQDVVANDVMCLEYTYADETIKNVVVQADDYEPFTDDGEDPPVVLTVTQPIYKIVDDSGTLKVEQISRNHFALTDACVNGTILKFLTAL
jgi:hypothetical protein